MDNIMFYIKRQWLWKIVYTFFKRLYATVNEQSIILRHNASKDRPPVKAWLANGPTLIQDSAG